MFSTLISFILLKNHNYEISFENKVLNEDFLIIVGAASQFTGGGMKIAPDAFKRKEKINLLYSLSVNRIKALKLLLGVLLGTHLSQPEVKNMHIDDCKISTQSKNLWASLVYGDGEYLGKLPVNLSIGKKPLRVLVPR